MKSIRDIVKNLWAEIKPLWQKSSPKKFWNSSIRRAVRLASESRGGVDKSLVLPLLRIAAALWLVTTAGIAVGSFFTFFCSLLLIYFILTKVFGVELDIADVVTV